MVKRHKNRGRLVFVLGGASSGKSQVALDLAGRRSPKAFVATGQAFDREMAERIGRHRASRPSEWITAEVPVDLADWFRREGRRYRTIVVDCLTLWLSNLNGRRVPEGMISGRVVEVLAAARSTGARVVFVSNELGLGLVPVARTARRFRDWAGRVNQQVAAAADEVYLVVSGLPLRLK